MQVVDSILEAVGGTPLVRLGRLARGLEPTLLAKIEYMNPGGSVKDRIALAMVEQAERDGLLRAGGTIIEPTSGNTGAGLAIVAALKGYRCVFVLPDKVSGEKIALLRGYGAEVVVTPTAVAPESPESYYSVAERLTQEIPGAFRPDQYANQANPTAHYHSTGPELWEQTGGRIDVLVLGVGTGGTVTGAGRYLKERNPDLLIVGADPEGSIYSGDDVHPYLVEGVGEDFWPTTFDASLVDRWIRVSDHDAFQMTRRLGREEGLLVGGSSGMAMAAAVEVAGELGPDKVVVVLLPDGGRGYISKVFNDDWMRQHGFLGRRGVATVRDVLANRSQQPALPPLITVAAHQRVKEAIDLLHIHNVSQLPVVGGDDPTDVSSIVGSVQEGTLLERLFRKPEVLGAQVVEAMDAPLPTVDIDGPIDDAFELFSKARSTALLVTEQGLATSVVTRSDFLDHLASERAAAAGPAQRRPGGGPG
jgi:cystathionine beta-synthase